MYEKTQKILPEEKLQAKKIPFREGLYQSLFILFFCHLV